MLSFSSLDHNFGVAKVPAKLLVVGKILRLDIARYTKQLSSYSKLEGQDSLDDTGSLDSWSCVGVAWEG